MGLGVLVGGDVTTLFTNVTIDSSMLFEPHWYVHGRWRPRLKCRCGAIILRTLFRPVFYLQACSENEVSLPIRCALFSEIRISATLFAIDFLLT